MGPKCESMEAIGESQILVGQSPDFNSRMSLLRDIRFFNGSEKNALAPDLAKKNEMLTSLRRMEKFPSGTDEFTKEMRNFFSCFNIENPSDKNQEPINLLTAFDEGMQAQSDIRPESMGMGLEPAQPYDEKILSQLLLHDTLSEVQNNPRFGRELRRKTITPLLQNVDQRLERMFEEKGNFPQPHIPWRRIAAGAGLANILLTTSGCASPPIMEMPIIRNSSQAVETALPPEEPSEATIPSSPTPEALPTQEPIATQEPTLAPGGPYTKDQREAFETSASIQEQQNLWRQWGEFWAGKDNTPFNMETLLRGLDAGLEGTQDFQIQPLWDKASGGQTALILIKALMDDGSVKTFSLPMSEGLVRTNIPVEEMTSIPEGYGPLELTLEGEEEQYRLEAFAGELVRVDKETGRVAQVISHEGPAVWVDADEFRFKTMGVDPATTLEGALAGGHELPEWESMIKSGKLAKAVRIWMSDNGVGFPEGAVGMDPEMFIELDISASNEESLVLIYNKKSEAYQKMIESGGHPLDGPFFNVEWTAKKTGVKMPCILAPKVILNKDKSVTIVPFTGVNRINPNGENYAEIAFSSNSITAPYLKTAGCSEETTELLRKSEKTGVYPKAIEKRIDVFAVEQHLN